MTDEQEVPDFYDPKQECNARRTTMGVIGAPWHTHLCRQPADHVFHHTCHSCGTTWGWIHEDAA